MKYLLVSLFFLNAPNTFAGNRLAPVGLAEKRSPYINQLIFEHIKERTITDKNFSALLENLQKINELQKNFSQINIFSFLITETYKNILNYKQGTKNTKALISSNKIKQLKAKLEKYDLVYSDFAKFIINSSLEELSPFIKNKFLDRFQNTPPSSKKDRTKWRELKKIDKYIGPWINTAYRQTPEEFNHYLLAFALNHYELTMKQLSIYKIHSPPSNKEEPALFTGLGKVSLDKKQIQKKSTDTTIPKNSAKDIEKIKLEKKPIPHKKIDQLINNI